FREEPGILAGTVEPDYVKCVSLASQDALKALILPAFLAVVLPLLVGFVMGPEALGAFLGGAIITGILFALLMANAGSVGPAKFSISCLRLSTSGADPADTTGRL
ncbi:MAG: sodium/proton-translocating pyrophosphatase, partial [Anaerolineae bacterium]